MKTMLRPVIVAMGVAAFNVPAQTPALLGIQTYAGLSITGEVGAVYSVEFVTDLSQTNNPAAWRCLDFVQLPASPYLWTDKSAPTKTRRFYRAVVFPAPTNMVFIPPGTFRMGSPSNEVDRMDFEGPQTAVAITHGFWMGKYEVTQAEYLALRGNNPSTSTNDLALPVDRVSWVNARSYCSALTVRERAAGRIPVNCVYRLPTEAEWEYACRGWTSTRYAYGDDPGYTNLGKYAWHKANGGSTLHPVGQKLPNAWGLFDMHGNAAEWCQDWLESYPGGTSIDPQGPSTGTMRVFRGACYACHNYSGDCRSAIRAGHPDSESESGIGFRCVLAASLP